LKESIMSGRPVNEDRQAAIAFGLRTYTGTVHSKCGTNQRYVSGGACVHCARVIATEQREARKFLKAQAKLDIELQASLDIEDQMVLEQDDAEARARQAIEDLM